jgi:hypothetical protein
MGFGVTRFMMGGLDTFDGHSLCLEVSELKFRTYGRAFVMSRFGYCEANEL